MYNLNLQKSKKDGKRCYFIFLTDYDAYLKKSKKGTRFKLPMYDKATINRNTRYTVTNKTALKNTQKYPDGFFNKNYTIRYRPFTIKDKKYWYFILKI